MNQSTEIRLIAATLASQLWVPEIEPINPSRPKIQGRDSGAAKAKRRAKKRRNIKARAKK